MKSFKVRTSLLWGLLIFLLMFGMAGCEQKNSKEGATTKGEAATEEQDQKEKAPAEESKEESKEENKEENKEEAKEASAQREIVDMAGRKVILPAHIQTMATPNVDAYRILLQLGAQDMLIGAPDNMYGSKYSEDDTTEVYVFPKVKEMTKVGGGPPGTEINAEAIVALNPDVVIAWSYGNLETAIERAEALQEKTKKPVVCLNSIAGAMDPKESIIQAYTLMGELTGKKERAQALIDYYFEQADKITAKVAKLEAKEQKKIYLSSPGGILRASSNYYPITQLGAINVAEGLGKKGGEIAKEQLISWNPDFIFMHTPSKNFRVNMDEILKDPSLSQLAAIKENRIYRIKCYYMGWDIATGLTDLYYMAKITYPSLFEDVDMIQKGNEILKEFYQKEGLYDRVIENSSLYQFD